MSKRYPPSQPVAQLSEIIRQVERYGEACYRAGLEEGLAVAERIAGWLTQQPDDPRQAEVREWAARAIARARSQTR
jgi:hypothetical protein